MMSSKATTSCLLWSTAGRCASNRSGREDSSPLLCCDACVGLTWTMVDAREVASGCDYRRRDRQGKKVARRMEALQIADGDPQMRKALGLKRPQCAGAPVAAPVAAPARAGQHSEDQTAVFVGQTGHSRTMTGDPLWWMVADLLLAWREPWSRLMSAWKHGSPWAERGPTLPLSCCILRGNNELSCKFKLPLSHIAGTKMASKISSSPMVNCKRRAL